MIVYEKNRVTKWLYPREKHWLLNEGIRIEKSEGVICVIEERKTESGHYTMALFRVPENQAEKDVYYPCGCIVFIEDPDKDRHYCEYHETKPGAK
jgi:hypothetical protein